MKKSVGKIGFLFLLFIVPLTATLAQENDPLVESFMRNFARASLNTKIQIIQDARESENENMGPLYLQAIDFVLTNSYLLNTDPMAQQLAVLGAKYIGEVKYAEAKYQLWQLFQLDKDTTVRFEIMMSLGEIAQGDEEIIEKCTSWLSSQNSLFQTGSRVDNQVVSACIISLGKLGDVRSFPILFTARTLGYSDVISKYAEQALYNIKGDFKELIIQVMQKNSVSEKYQALVVGLQSSELSDEEKGEIAEAALQIALVTSSPLQEETGMLRQIRYQAILALTERAWSKATPFVIEYFDLTVLEYDRKLINKAVFVAAIDCLGAMRNREAAERLNLYLGLLNSYIEGGQQVDEQIALAVINNLGKLGDQIASDNLLFVAYIDYPDPVKKAAREAFKNLKRR